MIVYKDICQLVTVKTNGYGDQTIDVIEEIDCLFLQSTGNIKTSNVDIQNSDAHVYLDPENSFIMNLGYRLEGLHIIANTLGSDSSNNWYRISTVVVGQRKLLDNDVDNIHCFLRRVKPLEYEYVS